MRFTENSEYETAPERLPLDERILHGIPLSPYIDSEESALVIKKLNRSFDDMRHNDAKEFGVCIAYGTDVMEDKIIEIDGLVIDVAKQQNHGMITHDIVKWHHDSEGDKLWSGIDPHTNKQFLIGKHICPIVFDDGAILDGLLYTLTRKK